MTSRVTLGRRGRSYVRTCPQRGATLRNLMLFLHILSALGVFMALGMEALAIGHLRLARTSDAASDVLSAALAAIRPAQRVMRLSLLLLLLTGLRLVPAYGSAKGVWIAGGLAGLVLVAAIGGLATDRVIRRLRTSAGMTEIVQVLGSALSVLWPSFMVRTALVVGAVYLMTFKPS